ncbi:MAG: cobalt ECF transporter T component CbiQ [Candidatus Magnetoovum sp. WYHC-5]|nr:cobalt ECF transporter T component CbiQ [Candidatus Magnetoovum sp. WYHC-5]
METLFENLKRGHGLSMLDVRAKIAIALVLLVMNMSYKGFVFPLMMFLICLYLCLIIKIPIKIFLLRFSEPLFIVVVILILKVFTAGNEVLFSVKINGINLIAHKDGLMEGLTIGSTIVGGVSIVAALGFSTTFTELMAGLSWFRVPKGFIEISLIAYRYIFVLLEDAMVIYNAQKNRLGYTTIKVGLRSFGTLVGSLVLKAFENSQNITISMLQRGYDGNLPLIKQNKLKSLDILLSLAFLSVMGALWSI